MFSLKTIMEYTLPIRYRLGKGSTAKGSMASRWNSSSSMELAPWDWTVKFTPPGMAVAPLLS